MRVSKLTELPATYACKLCGKVKPIAEMCLVHTKGQFYLRPRCKTCHNARETGHRREYKRNYLRAWRRRNAKLNESYWRDNPILREKMRLNAARRLENGEYHEAVLIQGRLRRSGTPVTIAEAKQLLKQFGRCYPSRYGLTPDGLRECERIRAAMRRRGSKRLTPLEIRIMVYEDGHFIKPSRQPVPYESAARNMSNWQRQQKQRKSLPAPTHCATLRATSVAATA